MKRCTKETQKRGRCSRRAADNDLQLCHQHYQTYKNSTLTSDNELTQQQQALLATIRHLYPTGWFNATNVRSSIKNMKALEHVGYVESSIHAGTLNFKLKKVINDG